MRGWASINILFLCLLLLSCTAVPRQEVEAIVRRDASFFSPQSPPRDLMERIRQHRVIVLGESHYIREHQDFLVELARESQDLGLILSEGMQAYGWLVEDYVLGLSKDLPEIVRLFDNDLIEGMRTLNASRPEEDRIRMSYFDMNHWQEIFMDSLSRMEDRIGRQEVFASILTLPPEQWKTEAYRTGLEVLQTELDLRREEFTGSWGPLWYERVEHLVRVELASADIRATWQDQEREELITELCLGWINAAQGQQVFINTGMEHAQKERLMGLRIDRLAHGLEKELGSLYSIAFIGLKGERKKSFLDEKAYIVDIPASSPPQDLARVLAQEAGERMAFLPLEDPDFFTRDFRVTYSASQKVRVSPARQFDAIITYPKVSLPLSMR